MPQICSFFTIVMSLKYIFLVVLISAFAFISFMPSDEAIDQFPEVAKVALRDAGNTLLLTNKDSTSLILPIIEIDKGLYQLSFQSELFINPDELVDVISKTFESYDISYDYRVEVIQCKDHEVAYSYQVNEHIEKSIIPCSERDLPLDCYMVNVRFLKEEYIVATSKAPLYALVAVGFIAFGLFYVKEKPSKGVDLNFTEIGDYKFYADKNKLVKGTIEISLSAKECELLRVLTRHINDVVKREILIKEVWEDHGVVVGRSLDTFISKLRKKFSGDDRVNIVGVHGVGYKLEVV
ncbi:MAG: helix-turn-helix domain-containing protein [Bacteroidota bacterium]